MSTAQDGNTVSIHYTGALSDGTEFDSSREREPLTFTVGSGQVIPGFNSNVIGMKEGETKTFVIPFAEAYGDKTDEAIQEVPKTSFPEDFEIRIGGMISGTTGNGQPFTAKILSEGTEAVTLDFNHPLAGEDLTFDVEVVSIS